MDSKADKIIASLILLLLALVLVVMCALTTTTYYKYKYGYVEIWGYDKFQTKKEVTP